MARSNRVANADINNLSLQKSKHTHNGFVLDTFNTTNRIFNIKNLADSVATMQRIVELFSTAENADFDIDDDESDFLNIKESEFPLESIEVINAELRMLLIQFSKTGIFSKIEMMPIASPITPIAS